MKLVNNQIQYIEFLSKDFEVAKNFYQKAFGWEFVDYGPEYLAFSGENIDGGFMLGEVKQGSVLVILYSDSLEESRDRVVEAGGKLTKAIFSFPGGRRFEFQDVEGNNLAVWSDK